MPRFQRRHYTAIAAVLQSMTDQPDSLFSRAEAATLTDRLAALFAEDNPRFDAGRFLTASGFDDRRISRKGR